MADIERTLPLDDQQRAMLLANMQKLQEDQCTVTVGGETITIKYDQLIRDLIGGTPGVNTPLSAEISSVLLSKANLETPQRDAHLSSREMIDALGPLALLFTSAEEASFEPLVTTRPPPPPPTTVAAGGAAVAAVSAGPVLSLDQQNFLTALTTKDRATILEELKKMLPAWAQNPQLEALATALANNNAPGGISGIDSDQKSDVLTLLSTLCPTLDAGMADAIATSVAEANTQRVADLNSIDDTAVLNALMITLKQSLAQTQTAPEVQEILLDGLKAMCKALVWLNRLRMNTTQLEAEFSKIQKSAQTAISKDMAAMAMESYTKSIEDFQKEYDQKMEQKKAQEKAKLWKILGPVISGLMAFVSIVVTCLTFGTAAPALLAAMIVAQAAISAMMIADQVNGWMDKSLENAGVNTQALRALIKFAVMLTIVVASGGIGYAATSAAQIAGMTAAMTTQMTTAFVMMAVSTLMSSGLLMIGLVAMFKAMGMDEKDSTIFAMVIMILMMIVAMVVAGGGISAIKDMLARLFSSGAQVAAQAATQTAAEAIKETLKEVAAFVKNLLTNLMKSLTGMFSSAVQFTSTISKLLEITSAVLHGVAAAEEAESSEAMAGISEQMGVLKQALADLNAALETAKASQHLLSISSEKSVEFIKSVQQAVQEFIEVFATIVEGLSKNVSQAATQTI